MILARISRWKKARAVCLNVIYVCVFALLAIKKTMKIHWRGRLLRKYLEFSTHPN